MANHKSAEKRARQAVKRNDRNSKSLSSVRTWEKKIRAAIALGDSKAAQTALSDYTSKVTKAATKGVVHAKTAARKIARLSVRVTALGASK